MRNAAFFLWTLLGVHAGVNGSCSHFRFDKGFIYCKAYQDDLEYALNTHVEIADATVTADVPLQNLNFSWDPGTWIGIGWDLGCAWSVDLVGTYLHSKAAGSIGSSNTTPNDFVQTLWFQSFTGFKTASAAANWTLDFATIDLLATRAFKPWNRFTFASHFGLRSVWIKQRYQIDYNQIVFTLMDGTSLLFPAANLKFYSRFAGIGLTAGTGFSFPLGCQFSFNGDISGTLVYGYSKVIERVSGAFPVPGDGLIATNAMLPNNTHHVRANFEVDSGFSYAAVWWRHLFEFYANYFFSVWFDQNDFFNLVFTTTNIVNNELSNNLATIEKKHGNIQLHGFVFGSLVHF